MKNKPTNQIGLHSLPDLLAEETKNSNLPIPKSLRLAIKDFKEAYAERYGHLILGGVRSIAILMMAHGAKGLKEEADKLREEANIPI